MLVAKEDAKERRKQIKIVWYKFDQVINYNSLFYYNIIYSHLIIVIVFDYCYYYKEHWSCNCYNSYITIEFVLKWLWMRWCMLSSEERELWIRAKYEQKLFLAPLSSMNDELDAPVSARLHSAVIDRDLPRLLLLLAHSTKEEINAPPPYIVRFSNGGILQSQSALHAACQLGDVVMTQLLIWVRTHCLIPCAVITYILHPYSWCHTGDYSSCVCVLYVGIWVSIRVCR